MKLVTFQLDNSDTYWEADVVSWSVNRREIDSYRPDYTNSRQWDIETAIYGFGHELPPVELGILTVYDEGSVSYIPNSWLVATENHLGRTRLIWRTSYFGSDLGYSGTGSEPVLPSKDWKTVGL